MENHDIQPNDGAEEQPAITQPDETARTSESGVETETDAAETQTQAEAIASESESETAPIETDTKDVNKQKRTVTILIGLLVIAVASLCAVSAFVVGSGFVGGREQPTPPPPTATPVATPEPGRPPKAVIDAATRGEVGKAMTFDGSPSAGATALVRFDWDFGDGAGGQGATVTHVYDLPGAYIVTLTVTDEKGLSDSTSVQVRIEEQAEPPKAVIQGPALAKAGEAVRFDGSASTGGRPIVNYAWNFGDGAQGVGAVVEHTYAEAGAYQVTLIVTDNAGETSEAVVEITIEPAEETPPTAIIQGPAQAVMGEKVTFDATGSQAGSSPIVNYAWDLGNGETPSGPRESKVTTTYEEPGTYEVMLTVIDENGLSHAVSLSIEINASLEGVLWQLEAALEQAPITAEFERGKLSGSTGCNQYTASYEITGSATHGAIAFSDITASRRVCEEIIMAQETQYLLNLAQVTDFVIEGDELTLRYPGGALIFTLAQPE
ncbi:MAG: PKD domain-containing protein [Chloroflexi bacterium]|nr:PKD domain-containing protein [Chloroflexota bacterium]